MKRIYSTVKNKISLNNSLNEEEVKEILSDKDVIVSEDTKK